MTRYEGFKLLDATPDSEITHIELYRTTGGMGTGGFGPGGSAWSRQIVAATVKNKDLVGEWLREVPTHDRERGATVHLKDGKEIHFRDIHSFSINKGDEVYLAEVRFSDLPPEPTEEEIKKRLDFQKAANEALKRVYGV